MTNLLVLREYVKSFYSKNEVFLTPAFRFLMAFISLSLINANLGYMSRINSIVIVLVIALMCSFLPLNMMIIVAAAFSVMHLYALSIECAAVALAVYLLLFLLYFRFSPKDTIVVLLTPICFMLKIPYVIPIAMGLIGTPASAISVGSGIIAYHMLANMSVEAATLGASAADGAVQKFRYAIDGITTNRSMMVTLVAFAITITIVYLIRRMSIAHAWSIAIVVGALADGIMLLLGAFLLDIDVSVLGILLGTIVSIGLAKILEFFVFSVDYSRTEMVQFEDDEYYYYVKAVPKIAVTAPEKRIKKINPQKNSQQNERSVQERPSQNRRVTTK